jgi:uncharacterized lipoprotein YbaY
MRLRTGLMVAMAAGLLVACGGGDAEQASTPGTTDQMTAAPAARMVRGTVAYAEGVALTPAASVNVTIENAAGEVVGSQMIESPGQVPVSWSVVIPAASYDPDGSYRVTASIVEGGQVRFTTPQAVALPMDEGAGELALMLQAPQPE